MYELVGGAVALAVMTFLLREVGYRGAPIITVVSALLLLSHAVGLYKTALGNIIPLVDSEASVEALSSMLKVTGLGYVYGIASDVCRDIGESGISKALDVVGRVEILLIAVPYIKEIITLGAELI
jgi:hypothetical protein